MRKFHSRYMKLCVAFVLTVFVAVMAALPAAEAQSLWGDRGSGNLFSDRKARNVGDIVTIVINEATTQSTTKSTSNSKSSSTNLNTGIGIFDFLRAASAGGSDSFKADGSATASNRVSAQVTVTVTEIMPNGNMVVEGEQSIWQGKNEHKISLRGVIRPDDISVNNTIPSTKVADTTMKFNGKGPLNAKQRQGILTQIFNFLF